MANDKYGSTAVVEERMSGQMPSDTEDVRSGGSSAPGATGVLQQAVPAPSESQYAQGEVAGDATVPTGEAGLAEAGLHSEVGSPDGSEAQEFEASASQLAGAESGQETALSDLRSIEGFEGPISSQEGAGAEEHQPLLEAGAAIEGAEQQEFLPILAALAPTLISTIGPAVAKGVMGRLSPRAKKVIQKLPIPRPPVSAGQVATAAKAAVKPQGLGALLPLIAKLLQQAQAKGGGESGMESEAASAVIEEATAVLEVIIGTDDRVRITNTTATDMPWRRICALRIQFPSGATYRGSGFLIGPRAVATAGHCVYLHNQGGWARRVEVIPGCNGSVRPYGQIESTSFRSVAGWVSGRKPESDYGCIVLPPNAFGGRNLGSFGFAAFDPTTLVAQPAVVAGFPGDKPFAEMWGMSRQIKTVTAKTLIYDIDTVGGQSGAPVYVKRNGVRYVVGIHNYGAVTGNSATRVTQEVYARLLAWKQL